MWRRPLIFAAWVGVVSFGAILPAQDATSGAGNAGAERPAGTPAPRPGSDATRDLGGAPARSTESLLQTDIIYLPGPQGDLVPVPLDADLLDYLKSRRPKADPPPTAAPFSIALVQVEGEADEDRAQLTARIQIQVNVDHEWVRVPLALQDVVLQSKSHQGDGEDAWDGFDREAGHRWWLRGRGKHEIVCAFSVPVRRQGSSRRVQLSLPEAAVTSFSLSVPGQATAAKALPEGSWVRTTVKGSRSIIDARGRLGRFDLTWQPVSTEEQTQTVLQSETSIALDISEESLVLEADQAIEAVEGSFSEIRVRIPAGFAFLDVEEKYSRIASARDEGPDRPDFILVQLMEPTKGPVFLHWTLAAAFPKGTGRIIVDGFEVQQAVRQSGEILIGPADGFRVTRREGEAGYVHRSQPSAARASKPWSSAWRFLKQPFKLTLDVQEVEAYYTVEPRWKLHVAGAYVELDGVLQVHVARDRGAVQSLTLDWPAWKGDGWILQTVEAPQIIQRIEVEDADASARIRIRLEGRKVGSFQVPFRARRPLAAGTNAFDVSLPAALSSARGPSLVDVTCDENLETEVRRIPPSNNDAVPNSAAANAAAPNPAPAVAANPAAPPAAAGGPDKEDRAANWARTWKLRIDDASPRLAIRTMAHERVLRCESTADVTVRGDRVEVAQRMLFRVDYEPLAKLRLLVPRHLAENLGVLYNDKDVLSTTPVSAGLESDPRAVVRVMLLEPRTGEFSLVVRYSIDIPPDSSSDGPVRTGAQFTVPLIIPDETTVTATRLRLKGDQTRSLDVVGTQFQPGPATADWHTYLAPGAFPNASLRTDAVNRRATGAMVVERLWAQTRLDPSGAVEGRMWLRVDGATRVFPLTVPPSVELLQVQWNGVEIDRRVSGRSSNASDEAEASLFDLFLDDNDVSSGLLLLVWQQTGLSQPGLLRQPEFLFPAPEEGIPIRESAWELILPQGQHLLTPPVGYAGRFRWFWSQTHFHRVVLPEFRSPGEWLAAGLLVSGPPRPGASARTSLTPAELARINDSLSAAGDDGNHYVFTHIGGLGASSLGTISFAMLVLAGAGAAWMGGLVLVKLPAARNAVVILSVGLALVAIGLVFPASFALLAQPAVAGLMLAALMAGLERMLSRDREPPILTINAPSDPGRAAPRASSVARLNVGAGIPEPAPRSDVSRPEISLGRPDLAGTGSAVGGARQ